MGERKVLNKYFPPDFDPSKIPRMKRPKNHQIEVRMMLPFSVQCNSCSEFMYRGKKFNSKKEDVEGDDYKGIRKFRFYIKCVTCSQEIVFKTDPEKADYELEQGATRNFEVWKDEAAEKKAEVENREAEDKNDAMKALENRTLDSKIEMEILDALDEIRAVNSRHEHVDMAAVLALRARQEQEAKAAAALVPGSIEAEEALIKNLKFGGVSKLKRLSDSEDSDADEGGSMSGPNRAADVIGLPKVGLTAESIEQDPMVGVVVKKRLRDDGGGKEKKKSKKDKKSKHKDKGKAKAETEAPDTGLGGLMGGYGSDDSG